MFYTEEDVQPAVTAAEQIFGKPGSMDYGKNVLYNVHVFTREFGKLWYGDVSAFDVADKLKELHNLLNVQVFIINDMFETITVN